MNGYLKLVKKYNNVYTEALKVKEISTVEKRLHMIVTNI